MDTLFFYFYNISAVPSFLLKDSPHRTFSFTSMVRDFPAKKPMSLIINLKVIPGAKHNKIIFDKSGQLVFYIKSVAQDNKANNELIDILRLKLKIAKSNISIISGDTARYKRVLLDQENITLEMVLEKLGLEKPESNMKIW